MNHYNYFLSDMELIINSKNICIGVKKNNNRIMAIKEASEDDLVGAAIDELFPLIFKDNSFSKDFNNSILQILKSGSEADLLISEKISNSFGIVIWGTYLYKVSIQKRENKSVIKIYNMISVAKSISIMFNVDSYSNLVDIFSQEKQKGNISVGNIAIIDKKIQGVCNLSFNQYYPNLTNKLELINAIRDLPVSKKTLYNSINRGSVGYYYERLIEKYSNGFVDEISKYDCIPDLRLNYNLLSKI